MLWRCFVVGLLKFGVTDEDLAMFAPVFWLHQYQQGAFLARRNSILTVDFQYSDMSQILAGSCLIQDERVCPGDQNFLQSILGST